MIAFAATARDPSQPDERKGPAQKKFRSNSCRLLQAPETFQ